MKGINKSRRLALTALVFLSACLLVSCGRKDEDVQTDDVQTESLLPEESGDSENESAETADAEETNSGAKSLFGEAKEKTTADKEITAVNPSLLSTGINTVAAVTADGHVVSSFAGDSIGTGQWTDIVSVAAGTGSVVGLKSNGTLVTAGREFDTRCQDWEDIAEICAQGDTVYGLHTDGTVLGTEFKDVVDIKSGYQCIFALCSDGTVGVEGSSELNQKDVREWTDIQAICVPHWCFGLKTDGTVVCTGQGFQEKVAEWTDIVALYEGSGNDIIGKKADGTYLCTSEADAAALAGWTDLVTITGNDDGIFAICSDGTVVTSVEDPDYCVSDWTGIATGN